MQRCCSVIVCGNLFSLVHFVIDFVTDMHLGPDTVGGGDREFDIKLMENFLVGVLASIS